MEMEVKRETLVPCMTCPLCSKLFRVATTITECLHTFCRKCIYKKLSDEEMECCPICNTYLGCVPLDKLRLDHNLHDIRVKIFPSKKIKAKATDAVTPVTLPARRKERSLSSLVVSTPRVSMKSGVTGKRSKSIARKASKGSNFTIKKSVKKEDDCINDDPERSSSPETLNKYTRSFKQKSATTKPSSHLSPDKGRSSCSETLEGKAGPDKGRNSCSGTLEAKADCWDPLNFLAEAANDNKSLKLKTEESVAKSEALYTDDKRGQLNKTKNKDKQKSKVMDEKDGSDQVRPESERPKKYRRTRKEERDFGDFGIPSHAVLDAGSAVDRRNYPIWFSLIALDKVEGDVKPLPQISAGYIRIKDGSTPVSFIQKYLKLRLNLTSKDEVEVKCMGQTVIPTLTINDVLDLWLQTTREKRVMTTIGSSAKDFVMVLGYARRV